MTPLTLVLIGLIAALLPQIPFGRESSLHTRSLMLNVLLALAMLALAVPGVLGLKSLQTPLWFMDELSALMLLLIGIAQAAR